MNHDQAKAVQQCDHRQQQRIGVRREPSDGQVRTGEQREIGHRVLRQIPVQALFLVGFDEQQCHGGDDRGEAEQNQSALRRFGSGGMTVTGDCGCVVMTLPGSSFPVLVVG